MVASLADVTQGIDDPQVRGAVGGDDSAYDAYDTCDRDDNQRGECSHVHGDGHTDAGARHRFDHEASEQDADRAANQRNRNRFAKQQFKDASAREAEGAQDGDFAGAFADRHGHGVGADEQGSEHDGSADAEDECLDVAQSGDEIGFECLFAFAFGGNGAAVENGINGAGGFGHVLGGIDAREIETGGVLEPVDRLFQILGAEIEIAGRGIDGVDAANGQVKIGGEDGALQNDVVADLPVVFAGWQ